MTSVTRALTWAIPVDYDEFIPALIAYNAMRPKVQEILKSKQLPQSESCFMSRLPNEIIDQICSYPVHEEIDKQRARWQETFKACQQGDCTLKDHLDEQDLDDMSDDEFRQASIDEYNSQSAYQVHSRNVDTYYHYLLTTSAPSLETDNFFASKLLENFAADFGLQTFFATQFVTFPMTIAFDTLKDDCTPEWSDENSSVDSKPKEVIAYITLPYHARSQGVDTEDSITSPSNPDVFYNSFAFFDIVHHDPQNLDNEHQRRFLFAMNLLQLKPHISNFQLQSVIDNQPPALDGLEQLEDKADTRRVVEGREKDVDSLMRDLEKSSWPKFMSLNAIETCLND